MCEGSEGPVSRSEAPRQRRGEGRRGALPADLCARPRSRAHDAPLTGLPLGTLMVRRRKVALAGDEVKSDRDG